ncbi:MAG: hypothetical protein ABSG75_06105 [Syntrophales bacterium]|jgi:hypothetical protein
MKEDDPGPKKKATTPLRSIHEETSLDMQNAMLSVSHPLPEPKKEAYKMSPKIEVLDNPKASRYWSDHLEYLLTNKPKDVWRMFVDDRLEKELDSVAEKAEIAKYKLEQKGLQSVQADEIVREDLVSPYLDQEPPDPLPSNIVDLIRDWARKILLAS